MAQTVFDIVFTTFSMLGVIYFCSEMGKFFTGKSSVKVEMKLIIPENTDAAYLIKDFVRNHAYDKRFDIKIIIPNKYIVNCTDPELIKLIETGIVKNEE